LIVSDVAALVAITGVELEGLGAAFELPASLAVTFMLIGLAVTSAIVGVPASTQFGLLVDTLSPVPAGNPVAMQLFAASGRIPPVVGMFTL